MQPISTTNLYELRYFLTERDTHPAHFLRGCEVALWPNKQSQETAKNLPQIYPFRRYMTCSKMPVRSTISEDSSHLRCLFLLRSLSPSLPLSLSLRTRQAFGGEALPASLGVFRSSNSSLSRTSELQINIAWCTSW